MSNPWVIVAWVGALGTAVLIAALVIAAVVGIWRGLKPEKKGATDVYRG